MIDCQVLVVGAGPAGMAAAASAAASGRRVTLVDNGGAPGGQIWRSDVSGERAGHRPHAARRREWSERLEAAGVELRSGYQVVARPGLDLLRVEKSGHWEDIRFEALILATGARERFLPFPGWTLPGVLGIGGLQALVKGGLPVLRKRVVLAGTGPLLLAVAAGLVQRGAQILGVFEQAPLARLLRLGLGLRSHPRKLLEAVAYRVTAASAPFHTNAWVMRAEGAGCLRSVIVRTGGRERSIDCDYLASGFHLVPNLELPRLMGCQIEDGFVAVNQSQISSLPNVYCAGEITGVGGLDKALVEGEIAGLAAAGHPFNHLLSRRRREASFAQRLGEAFALRHELRAPPRPETLVCRCEDVALGALAGMRSWREAKLHTRCGMGPCQGRICGPAVAEYFGWEEEAVRPPVLPARVLTLAAVPGAAGSLETAR